MVVLDSTDHIVFSHIRKYVSSYQYVCFFVNSGRNFSSFHENKSFFFPGFSYACSEVVMHNQSTVLFITISTCDKVSSR